MTSPFEPQKKYEANQNTHIIVQNFKQTNTVHPSQALEIKIENFNQESDRSFPSQSKDTKDKSQQGITSSINTSQNQRNPNMSSDPSNYYGNKRSGRNSILRQSRYGKALEGDSNSQVSEVPLKRAIKEEKKEKISFKQDIEEVKVVENWKDYNNDDYGNTTCHCNTF